MNSTKVMIKKATAGNKVLLQLDGLNCQYFAILNAAEYARIVRYFLRTKAKSPKGKLVSGIGFQGLTYVDDLDYLAKSGSAKERALALAFKKKLRTISFTKTERGRGILNTVSLAIPNATIFVTAREFLQLRKTLLASHRKRK